MSLQIFFFVLSRFLFVLPAFSHIACAYIHCLHPEGTCTLQSLSLGIPLSPSHFFNCCNCSLQSIQIWNSKITFTKLVSFISSFVLLNSTLLSWKCISIVLIHCLNYKENEISLKTAVFVFGTVRANREPTEGIQSNLFGGHLY